MGPLTLSGSYHGPGTQSPPFPPHPASALTMTETCRDPRDCKRIRDGDKYLPLTDYQGVRGRSEWGAGP